MTDDTFSQCFSVRWADLDANAHMKKYYLAQYLGHITLDKKLEPTYSSLTVDRQTTTCSTKDFGVTDRFLIVGLGNPGKEYKNTRHNIGFQVVEELAAAYGLKFDTKKSNAKYADGIIRGQRVTIAKPQTYMNLSGNAVKGLMDFFKIPIENIIIVLDHLDVPLGTLRIRPKGGSGGQNGLKHIIQQLGNNQNFARIRLGISRPPGSMNPAKYVLRPFKGDEEILARETVDQGHQSY